MLSSTAGFGQKRSSTNSVTEPIDAGIGQVNSTDRLNYDQLEAQFHQVLGRFFVTVASIELNLSLRVGGTGSYSEKLERFLDFAGAHMNNHDDEYCEALSWYMAADAIREVRNLFAHGRWGILPAVQLIAHVSGYPPETQSERRFSLPELEAIVKEAELLNMELAKIR
jgi:hypothetical protein